ncbi:MAG: hypothetical protein Q9208_007731 [Pyrenodesmia sp. 3 TL-2023]
MNLSNPSTSTLLLDLPNELLIRILENVSKVDLKHIRLVCKHLSDLANPLSFSTVVISMFPTDLNVFKAISKRSHLSNSATKLVYDIQRFRLDDDYPYDRNVYYQIRRDFFPNEGESLYRVFGCECPVLQDVRARYEDATDLLLDGEASYKYQRDHQLDPSDPSFARLLTEGLPRFPNIQDIVVQDSWTKVNGFTTEASIDSRGGTYCYGALARNWNPLWLRPRTLLSSMELHQYWVTLGSALKKASIHPRRLDKGSSQPSFCRHLGNGCHEFFAPCPMDFSTKSLTSLKVRFAHRAGVQKNDPDLLHDDVEDILDAPSLKELDVGFARGDSNSRLLLQTILETTPFPLLTTLCLDFFTIRSTEFTKYLWQQPNLRNLYIEDLCLIGCTWGQVLGQLRTQIFASLSSYEALQALGYSFYFRNAADVFALNDVLARQLGAYKDLRVFIITPLRDDFTTFTELRSLTSLEPSHNDDQGELSKEMSVTYWSAQTGPLQTMAAPELLHSLGYDFHFSTAREVYALRTLSRRHLQACLDLCNLLLLRRRGMKALIADHDGNIHPEYGMIHVQMRALLRCVCNLTNAIRIVSEKAAEQIKLFKSTALILARGWSGGFVEGSCEMRSVFDGREFVYAWQRRPKGWWVVKGGRLVAKDVEDPEE